MIRSFDFLGAVFNHAHAHGHVGLTAAKPDIADEHFAKLDMLSAVNGERVGPPTGGGLNSICQRPSLPVTVLIATSAMLTRTSCPGLAQPQIRFGLLRWMHHVVAKHRTDKRQWRFVGRKMFSDVRAKKPTIATNRNASRIGWGFFQSERPVAMRWFFLTSW